MKRVAYESDMVTDMWTGLFFCLTELFLSTEYVLTNEHRAEAAQVQRSF
jgi:hypothetical protein